MYRIAQIAAAIGGLLFGVLGGAALVQTGITGFDQHVQVVGLHHTGALAWLELVLGLILLGTAFSWGAHAGVAFLGLLSLGFGLVVLITGRGLHDALGVHAENGILFAVAGVLLAVGGFIAGRTEAPAVAAEPRATPHTHEPSP